MIHCMTEREQLTVGCEWNNFSPLRSRVCLLKWTWDSLSKYWADGAIIKQNKHSFLVLVFPPQTEKTRPLLCVMCDSFSVWLHILLVQKNGVAAFLWPDSYSICHHFRSSHHHLSTLSTHPLLLPRSASDLSPPPLSPFPPPACRLLFSFLYS